ncbi:MAG: AraC family transcriptional regulator [Solirubrobacteraceae bacterium]
MSDSRTIASTVPLAGHELFHTSDLDEAREQVSRIFCPHRLELVAGHGALDARQNAARLRDVGLSYLSYGGEVRITPGELETFFLVQIPMHGCARIAQGRVEILSTPARASVLSATEPIDMLWHADNPQMIVRISRSAIEGQLAAMIGEPPGRAPRFALGMELASPSARSWLRLVGLLREEIEQTGPLIRDPATAAGLEELLIRALLLAQPSNYSSRLRVEVPPACSRVVRNAVEQMHARLSSPPTVTELARGAGVSVRALQSGFRRQLGVTPSTYLRDLRLEHAHHDLLSASPADGTTVTDVCLRWGFAHHGRFAESYRRRYGVSPAQTLRQ